MIDDYMMGVTDHSEEEDSYSPYELAEVHRKMRRELENALRETGLLDKEYDKADFETMQIIFSDIINASGLGVHFTPSAYDLEKLRNALTEDE